ncbi:MAG: NAD(P)-dependent oxidoreductase, partial [Calditrichota bacterium]
MKIFYEKDVNRKLLSDKVMAVLGYGSQGHAHSNNLKESGYQVVVGLYEGSKSKKEAEAAGLKVLPVSEAAQQADIIMFLTPDQTQPKLYEEQVKPYLKKGKALAFAHGFNIHYGQIKPPQDVDVWMVAPKGPGHLVRRVYKEGGGVPCLLAVHQDASGKAKEMALAYADGI